MAAQASLANLAGYGSALLKAFQSALTDRGVTLPKTDTGVVIAYTAPGAAVPFLSEGLVVNFVALRQGMAASGSIGYVQPAMVLSQAEYAVSLIREVSGYGGEGYDTADELQMGADFNVLLADATALWLAGIAIIQDPRYGANLDPGVPFVFGGVSAIDPQGGLAGNRWGLTVTLT